MLPRFDRPEVPLDPVPRPDIHLAGPTGPAGTVRSDGAARATTGRCVLRGAGRPRLGAEIGEFGGEDVRQPRIGHGNIGDIPVGELEGDLIAHVDDGSAEYSEDQFDPGELDIDLDRVRFADLIALPDMRDVDNAGDRRVRDDDGPESDRPLAAAGDSVQRHLQESAPILECVRGEAALTRRQHGRVPHDAAGEEEEAGGEGVRDDRRAARVLPRIHYFEGEADGVAEAHERPVRALRKTQDGRRPADTQPVHDPGPRRRMDRTPGGESDLEFDILEYGLGLDLEEDDHALAAAQFDRPGDLGVRIARESIAVGVDAEDATRALGVRGFEGDQVRSVPRIGESMGEEVALAPAEPCRLGGRELEAGAEPEVDPLLVAHPGAQPGRGLEGRLGPVCYGYNGVRSLRASGDRRAQREKRQNPGRPAGWTRRVDRATLTPPGGETELHSEHRDGRGLVIAEVHLYPDPEARAGIGRKHAVIAGERCGDHAILVRDRPGAQPGFGPVEGERAR